MKENMSNIDIRLILPELQKASEGAFIKNVYQYGDVFVLKLYQPAGGTNQLLIQPGRRIHLTEFRRVAPRTPPKFCTVLRKYLKDRKVMSVTQHDLDRIVVIEIGDETSSHKIVAELFGNGNLLLLDPKDSIFVAMRYRRMKDRDVVPKATYEFPPPRGVDVFSMEPDSFEELLSDSKANIVRTLASRLNLDSLSCEEICALAGISPKTKVPDLTEQEMKDLRGGLDIFAEKLKTGVSNPCIVLDDEPEEEEEPQSLAFLPFKFEVYNGQPSQAFDSFSQTIDDFFGVSDAEMVDEEKQDAFSRERKRLQTIIDKQAESISRLEEKAAKLRVAGEAIYSHFQISQEILETITDARAGGLSWKEIMSRIEEGRKKGIPSAVAIKRIVPSQGKIVVDLTGVEVSLDVRMSPQDNATAAYDQAKKSEAKAKGAQKQIEHTKEKLETLEASSVEPETKAPRIFKIRKKHWYEKFRWFLSSEGHLVLGGRDVKTNERLAKRQMGANDVFLHASLHGAPYTIIKVPDKAPGEQTLQEAAQFAVTFSRAWQDGLSSGDAYWVNPEQVSFTPPSGEYLPAGAVMIYGTKNFIRNAPVELAVGILLEEEHAIPVSGPISAISSHTDYFLKVAPGDVKKGQLVKSIISMLRKDVPEDKVHLLEQIPQEDLMRALPAGNGKVITD
jgi:predicted ribosome quality control (RQC) complex YloA/Tae2 family protein